MERIQVRSITAVAFQDFRYAFDEVFPDRSLTINFADYQAIVSK